MSERAFERAIPELTARERRQKQKFLDGLMRAADRAGLDTENFTSAELQDMLRTQGRRITASQMRPFLEAVGIEAALRLDECGEAWRQGDRIGTLSIKGRDLAVTVHLVATAPFGTHDVALEMAQESACDEDAEDPGTSGAFVLCAHPSFRFTHGADGRILKVVVQAGWLMTLEGWRDVTYSPKGADDLEDQLPYFRSAMPSRGYFRDRGFEATRVLDPLTRLASDVDSLSEVRDVAVERFGLSHEELRDPAKYTPATGPDGWSRMMHRRVLELMDETVRNLR